MGWYRLLLAYMVLYSHLYPPIMGYNIGTVAVISFFILSGYVMTGLVFKYYFSLNLIKNFYKDRFYRLAPQFYFYSFLTLILASIVGLRHPWMAEVPGIWSTLTQLLFVPLNFYTMFPNMLVPQAWSIGLEAIFYLLFPFILILNGRAIITVLSLIIFAMALRGTLNFDLWGYRYLPGTFFIFMIGSFLYKSSNRYEKYFPLLAWLSSLVLLIIAYFYPLLLGQGDFQARVSVLAGLAVGIPIIISLKKNENSKEFSIGDLSYGVFLNHVLIYSLIVLLTRDVLGGKHDLDLISRTGLLFSVAVLATLLAYLSFLFIERPLIKMRKNLRSATLGQTWNALDSTTLGYRLGKKSTKNNL